jgi:DNA-binding XRE family transcriptional regulator
MESNIISVTHILIHIIKSVVYCVYHLKTRGVVTKVDKILTRLLPRRISQIRLTLELTQEAAASRANLPFPTYQALESRSEKKRFNPTLDTLFRVAHALETSVSDLTRPPTEEEVFALMNESKSITKRVKSSKRRV